MGSKSFEELAGRIGGFRGTVVALDPGETTGYAVFRAYRLITCGQFPSGHLPLAWNNMCLLIRGLQGEAITAWETDPKRPYANPLNVNVNVNVNKGEVRLGVPKGVGVAEATNSTHASPHPEGESDVGRPLSETKVTSPLPLATTTSMGSPTQTGTTHFVIEDYRVYSFKLDTHKFSQVYTIKVLAIYEALAALYGAPTKLTLAQAAKTFCTDRKLEEWGFWVPSMRHARDAIRHATYYIVQNQIEKVAREASRKWGFEN